MPVISIILLGISWGWSVYSFGGVQVTSWRWTGLGIGVAGLLLWLFQSQSAEGKSRRLDVILLLLILMIGILQVVPVPLSLIRLISPHRFVQLQAASQAAGPIASATLSSAPTASRDELFRLTGYVGVFLLVCDLRRRLLDRHWLLAAPIILVVSLEAILGLVQYYSGMDVVVGTYVNRNHFAGLLEMGIPFALMFGFMALNREHSRFQSPAMPSVIACTFFGLAAAMLVSVINSQSRMGFLAVLGSLLVSGVVGISSRFSTGSSWRRWLPVIAVVAIVGMAFIFLPTDQLIGRFALMATTQEPSEDTRKVIWEESLPLIADYKMAGCGLGAFESCFLGYKKVAPEFTVDYAHNDYLQVMAELGMPGSILILSLVVLAYGSALRRTVPDNPGRYLAIACVGSLTAILIHSGADFNLYVPANGMLAVWVGGMARAA